MAADLDNSSVLGVYLAFVMGCNSGFLTAASATARTVEGGGAHEVAGKTQVMADMFLAPSDSDITPAFHTYLQLLPGRFLSRPARLRGGAIATVLGG